jgi:hypothetical protein
MHIQEARDAYDALSRLLKDFEKNLEQDEYVGISGVGPNSREFIAQSVYRVQNLVMVVGTDLDDNFHQLIFAPGQIAVSVFAQRCDVARTPIGFHQE